VRTTLITFLILNFSFFLDAYAGSATWSSNPSSGDWFTAANWTPNTIPNGPDDIATFDVSNTTDILLPGFAEVDSIVFNPGASAYTLTVPWYMGQPNYFTLISGMGIVNNSGVSQNFVSVEGDGFAFGNSATAGNLTVFWNPAGPNPDGFGGRTVFGDGSNAGSGTFINGGAEGVVQGITYFFNDSSAANATIINEGAAPGDGLGGATYFFDDASAGTATLINNGGAVTGGGGGLIRFYNNSTAADATFITNGGTAEAALGAVTDFWGGTMGNATFIANGTLTGPGAGRIVCIFLFTTSTARIELFGTGTFDISNNQSQGQPIPVTVGSLEGDGLVFLGANQLTVGSNNLSTLFSGVIQDGGVGGGEGGSVTKIGRGSLVLVNANTYTGGTTVEDGELVINNQTGSGTGSGAVQVNTGRLIGRGTIAGPVIIGDAYASPAVLAPERRGGKPANLTIQGALTFNTGATYKVDLNTKAIFAGRIAANGVTVSDARFSLVSHGSSAIPGGTVFTVISNTAATPISGTFANLPDGSTFTVGPNTFQVNYEGGGDGNDLTLTVVP